MVLNIFLLLLSSAATLAAFGGETWEKGTKPLIQRITARGWISLGIMIAAFTLAVLKESQENAASRKLQEEKDLASAKLAGANNKLDSVEGELTRARQQLDTVGDDLIKTKDELSSQTKKTLIATLAQQQAISRWEWDIQPFPDANNADLVAYLAVDIPAKYKPVARALIRFRPWYQSEGISGIDYSYSGTNVSASPFIGHHTPPELTPSLTQFVSETDYNPEVTLTQRLTSQDEAMNAALYYRYLESKPVIGSLTLSFSKIFTNHDQFFKFSDSNRNLERLIARPLGGDGRIRANYKLPQELRDAFINRWRSCLKQSRLRSFFKGNSLLTILCEVGISDFQEREHSITANFRVTSAPELAFALSDFDEFQVDEAIKSEQERVRDSKRDDMEE
jgi:hypothetical protein